MAIMRSPALPAIVINTGAGAAAGAAVAAVPTPVMAGAPDSTKKAAPDVLVVVLSAAAVLAAWMAITGLDLYSSTAIKLAEGVSALALFYVAAQAIERVLEPIAALAGSITGYETSKTTRDRDVAAALNAPTDTASQNTAANAQTDVDKGHANRAVAFWAAASIIGMAASASLGIYLVQAITTQGAPGVDVDLFITALAIGGGTKPLHDLISRIEKAKQQSSTPAATAPGG